MTTIMIRRPCIWCNGKGRYESGGRCIDCLGSGLICWLCDKRAGVCECVEDDVKPCEECGKMPAACRCGD
jgi:hypothetical protein